MSLVLPSPPAAMFSPALSCEKLHLAAHARDLLASSSDHWSGLALWRARYLLCSSRYFWASSLGALAVTLFVVEGTADDADELSLDEGAGGATTPLLWRVIGLTCSVVAGGGGGDWSAAFVVSGGGGGAGGSIAELTAGWAEVVEDAILR